MIADFSGRQFRLVPGIATGPRWLTPSAGMKVVEHPNHLGGPGALSKAVPAMVRTEPYLIDLIEIPQPWQLLVDWPLADPERRRRAGTRIRQAADFLRRQVRQLPGIEFLSPLQLGGTVAVLLPIPAGPLIAAWRDRGISTRGEVSWEGGLLLRVGWWHTRQQLAELSASLGAVLEGGAPTPVSPDQYLAIPDDLPRRRLDTIASSEAEELV